MTEQGPASHHDDEDEALEAAMRESLLIHQAASGPPSAHDDDDAPTPTASAWSGWSHKDLQSTPATSSSSHESLSNGPSYASSLAPSKSKLSQIEEDEAFARQLAQEEEQAVAAELSAMQAKTADASSSTVSSPEPPPPWTPPEAGPSTLSAPSSSPSLSSLHDRTPSPVRTRRHSESPNNVRPLPRPNRASMAMPSPPLPNTRPPSVDVASLHPPSLPSTRPPSMDAMSPPPPQLPTLTRPTSVVSASELTGVNELWLEEESPTLLEPTPAPSARFIDPELTRGISMSFAAPNLAESALPELAVPDVVELPYGKAAPMHIQAPSWRQMLKLLARMSGSRIEPTVEAIAQVKDGSGLRLRAVVQFVKVHPASPDWRTILYLTIDHDVPPSTPNAWRFTNGDVGTLPFSYTLSTVPALLRDSPDAPLAKWYAVPATQRLPYPTLPIEFPDLALYLHAALQESRKAIHDSSSGMRRLARMVDDFYPKEKEVDDLSPKKPFFRRLIGRGRNKEGGRNQDTYELVTPFIASEWG
ncbi:hypothetical protein PUNSTDRAFT_99721 [Punctularia strigosozonata HHB-11173 SS5]|uniref:uncharacterized protein n=1 Tax=Punctularia strigosozonata (strain HHB-11173) TaxID=741275 RepID=UPI0004417EC7|nr:uncharacterized protein PUNSTDRAFT_99721 [Punctularia strigosozonata HHB-11173 SS5]EIN10301.1 hypothetical protein PUNSTDRAFT_99721 [Punctularia strigosozonata HHB-11173 SS5]